MLIKKRKMMKEREKGVFLTFYKIGLKFVEKNSIFCQKELNGGNCKTYSLACNRFLNTSKNATLSEKLFDN